MVRFPQGIRCVAAGVALGVISLPLLSLAQQTGMASAPEPTVAAPAVQQPSAVVPRVNQPAATAAPLDVHYRDGQLSIQSQGSTLAEVLKAVAQKTGATIDVPAGGGLEHVVMRSGPGAPDTVLRTLLTGSDFNFVILTQPRTPHIPAQILLFPRGAPVEALAQADTAPASASGDQEPQLYGAGFVVSADDAAASEAVAPPPQPEQPDAIPGPVLDQMQKDFLRQHQLQMQKQQQQQQSGQPPSSQ